ncbi:ASCH domain-containing protein [Arthrobacter citreus]|uniref:ASCH domain-containing protein n=1 Tax=Arthrobacter TaxID=1663 RepID=UPI00126476F4|nr:ASCH domain-containing protein [Arthrobacter gandavensis]
METSTEPVLDYDAAARFWDAYAAAFPRQAAAAGTYTVEAFGDSPELADQLLSLVLAGRKRATSSHVAEYMAEGEPLPRIGVHWVVCDGSGEPGAILRTTELKIGTFADADEAFARDEGEDDLSLASWRREHQKYWERTAAARGESWSERDELVFERFDLVWPARGSLGS